MGVIVILSLNIYFITKYVTLLIYISQLTIKNQQNPHNLVGLVASRLTLTLISTVGFLSFVSGKLQLALAKWLEAKNTKETDLATMQEAHMKTENW